MKKILLLCALAACNAAASAQTIFTYGSSAVGKDEFLRAYNKNNTPVTDKEKSIREYLELYSNFKLKVKAAEELRIDTLPQIQYDIANFRHQVEDNYLTDEKGSAQLMDEAFNRSQKDLHLVHFFTRIDPAAKPEDTLNAYKGLLHAAEALNKGESNYKVIADNNGVKYGDMGFITVFQLPYEYENIAYSLKPGQTSKPYRSKNAWHVFKLIEERNSAGKWKIAQILFTYPPDASEEQRKATMKKADSVYNLLVDGADFAKAASLYSDDKLTYMKGGEMPEFGTGKFRSDFEQEVFKLKNDNEITRPFATDYGVHIVKRLAFAATPTEKDNAGMQFELKQKLMQDSRTDLAKQKFAKDIENKIGFKKTMLVKEADLFRYADSISANPDASPDKFPISNKNIISFKKESVKAADWLKFVRDYKINPEQPKTETNVSLWDKYENYASLQYYKNHLEEYNNDFAYQMKEFKEGNMLFEIMERNVWSKAASDTAGLVELYNANKSKYKWAASADVLIFNCTNEKLAKETMDKVKAGKDWKEIMETSDATVQADSGRYELSQITDPTATSAAADNSFSNIIKNSDGSATFVKYVKVYPADQQRSFDEARGLVINDYQSVLEKKWLDALRKKYPVKVNEDVVKQVIK